MTDRDDRQPKRNDHGDHLADEVLNAFVDRTLTPDEHSRAAAHLESCNDCRKIFGGLIATASLLRELPQPVLRRSFQLSPEMARASAPIWVRLGVLLLPVLPALRTGTVAVALLLVAVSARNALVDSDGSDSFSDIPQATIQLPAAQTTVTESAARNTAQIQTNQVASTEVPVGETMPNEAESDFAVSADEQTASVPTDEPVDDASGFQSDAAAKGTDGETESTGNEEAEEPGSVGDDTFAADVAGGSVPDSADVGDAESTEGDADNSTMAMIVDASPEATSTTIPSPTASSTPTATATPPPTATATATASATATVTPVPTVEPQVSATQSDDDSTWRAAQIVLAIVFAVLLVLLVLLYRLRGRAGPKTN